jgi:glycerol-1-phosphate dehydrogenase [NAD(P)+]
MKITRYAVAPIALFADIDVLTTAPKSLVAAGVGDIFGKYTALADWRISNLLTGEYICDPTVKLQYQTVNKVKNSLVEYGKNKSDESYEIFCANLLEALVISGLCMQYTGNSRPASGCEHHVSHFFEMGIILSTDCLHGENVGVGSVLCAELYRKFADSENIKFVERDLDDDLVIKYYKNIYDEIIKENAPNSLKKITPEIFYTNLDGIKNIISDIPTKEKLVELLDIIGGVKDITGIKAYDLKCDKNEIATLALKLAPYIRDRVTLMKLMRCVDM